MVTKIGNGSVSKPSLRGQDPSVETPANPAPAPQANRSAFNALPDELKALVADRLDRASNKALGLANKSFHQVTAQRFKKINILASELGNLHSLLGKRPSTATVTITDLDDDGLAKLAAMDSATRGRITHIRAREAGITDAGLASLQKFTQLQWLDLSMCENLTDTGLASLQSLTKLQSLDLSMCENLTDDGLTHLQGLRGLQPLSLAGGGNLTDTRLGHLHGLTQLQSLNLKGYGKLTDAGLANLQGLRQLQSLDLRGRNNITAAGIAHLREVLSNCNVVR